MAETTNYGLYIEDDSSVLFKEWREKMNGSSNSNMVKIDTILKEIAEAGVVDITTEESDVSGGENKITFTLANGNIVDFTVRNGTDGIADIYIGDGDMPDDCKLQILPSSGNTLAPAIGNGGYYIPSVSQVDENTINISFEGNIEGMSEVPIQTIILPSKSAELTSETISSALGYTPANDALKANNSGWSANKNLGTDENGNVIEKDDIFTKDLSSWQPVELLNGASWTGLGYYWYSDGTLVTTQYTTKYQSTTEKIPVAPNASYTVKNFAGVITLYDANGINGKALPEHYNPNAGFTFETNSEQRYIGVSFMPGGAFTTDRVSIIRTTISEEEYNALPTKADTLKALYGKKIVCFGDSLFGMYRGDTSATAHIASVTGATVYNVGFGGCRMSVHPTNGYAAFSMWALAKAISENDWTVQESQVANGSSYFREQLTLLESIDFNTVDLIVIHYGTNDFTAGGGVHIDNESDPNDYNTLCGALRYSIEKLLTAYPKLQIYVSLPVYRYWTDDNKIPIYAENYTNSLGYKLSEFVEALRNVAIEYNFPVIDGYRGLGINRLNASTFLEDGVHHNEIGRQRFGYYIGTNLVLP